MNVRPEYEPLHTDPTAEPLSEDGRLTRQERWLAEQLMAGTVDPLDAYRRRHAEIESAFNVKPAPGDNRAQRRAAKFGRLK